MGQALLGLIGWPILHTASPAMMNQAFAYASKEAVYLPFAVSPCDLSVALNGLAAIGAHGVNVTIPHKTGAFDWVQKRTAEANLAGAVNTIRFDHENGNIGHNTDVIGWWKSIKPYFADNFNRVTILGSGGAALAITAALLLNRPAATVNIVARNGINRDNLYARFSNQIKMDVYDWELRHQVVADSQLIVNTTPIGMWPNVQNSPILDDTVFHEGQVVQDIVYRPLTTQFMSLAKRNGATVVDGLSMLVGQGKCAYEWWFKEQAPEDIMYQAARNFVLCNLS